MEERVINFAFKTQTHKQPNILVLKISKMSNKNKYGRDNDVAL